MVCPEIALKFRLVNQESGEGLIDFAKQGNAGFGQNRDKKPLMNSEHFGQFACPNGPHPLKYA
jgi:hypothetical protein